MAGTTRSDEARLRARAALQDALARLVQGAPGPPPRPSLPAHDPVPAPLPPLARPRPLRLRLPDGRIAEAVSGPALAQRDELAAIARAGAANDRTAFAMLAAQRRAVQDLERATEEARARLAGLEQRSDAAALRLLDAIRELRGQLGAVRRAQGRTLAARRGGQARAQALRAELAGQRTAAVVQQVSAISTALQSTALGDRGSVLAPANVVLAANQLFWSLLDPFLRRLGLVTGAAPSVLAIIAPVASLATAQALLGGRPRGRGQ
ncbi:MAG TPA: hypothetical protein VEB43_05015 [Anaeromyxobacter sp.]|nr:hypothetical protein [Anaeromyxobacter sp.]